ncbi:MAG: TniB family NTP-binding protein [Pseudomonadota bacterium]|nr:TniB family NTP-binding protein [Pseudomonadota bacterium]
MKPTYHTATYRTDVLEGHIDNPLITGLPAQFEPKEAHRRLKSIPIVPERELSQANKIELLMGLEKRITIPTNYHIDLYQHFYARIVSGYESRNPVLPEVIEWTLDAAESAPVFQLDDEDDPTSTGTGVLGKTGLGKTTTILSVLRRLIPQCIRHTKENFNDVQITYLVIDMPHDGAVESLCLNFFEAIDNALLLTDTDASYFLYYTSHNVKPRKMLNKIHFLCRKHHVGILVIDELQNLLVQTPKRRQLMLNFLSTLTNNSHVPIVKVGTSDALHLFKIKKTNIRRKGTTFQLQPYAKTNKYWKQLLETLFNFQLAPIPLSDTPENRSYLYELTQGYPYALLALWREIQIFAVQAGSKQKQITHSKIDEIWRKRFPLLRTVFRAIKHHRAGSLNDLLDAQHFLDTGYFDQAIKHLRQLAQDPNIKGRSAEEIAGSIDVMMDEVDLDPKQQEKVAKVKQRLHDKIGKSKAGQTYVGESK